MYNREQIKHSKMHQFRLKYRPCKHDWSRYKCIEGLPRIKHSSLHKIDERLHILTFI